MGSPSWADLLVAARRNPVSRKLELSKLSEKTCCNPHVLELNRHRAIGIINPVSPILLYGIAHRVTVLAPAQLYHQPVTRNDIIPTLSQAIN